MTRRPIKHQIEWKTVGTMEQGMCQDSAMFQRKIDKWFQGINNVFRIANNYLIAGFDDLSREHDSAI